MSTTQLGAVLRHIRNLATDPSMSTQTDGALIRAFLSGNDQPAFETLLRRHGPMVLRVCRRTLGNLHDAEDALQATFLVLARRANSIRKKESLASWLHGVAYRMATHAKRAASRRHKHESRVAPTHAPDPALCAAWQELQAVLDEEIGGLPESLREPFVICCLENKSCAAAARQLGLQEGTVWNRLGRARRLLQERLSRRGVTLSAGLLAGLLGQNTASALVPAALVVSTAQAATRIAVGRAAVAGLISTKVVAMTEGVLKAMFVSKLKTAALVVLAMVLTGMGVGALTHRTLTAGEPGAAPASEARTAAPPQREARATEPGLAAKEAKPTDADPSRDPLPDGAVARIGTTRLRHGTGIVFAAYFPDGKKLLTAGMDQTIRLWDLQTGEELRRFDWGKAAEGGGCQVALSPDGKVVAAARAGTLYLWDTATGKLLHEVATGQRSLQFGCLAFAADSKALLTVDPVQSALVWDVASGKNTKQLGKPSNRASVLAVSADCKYLASLCLDNARHCSTVKIKDLEADRELPEIKVDASNSTRLLTFSSDGKVLAWLGLEGAIVVWDVAAHKERLHLARKGSWLLRALALSAEGKFVAVCQENVVEIWDAETGKQVAQAGEPAPYTARYLMLQEPSLSTLAFSPDAKKLVAGFYGTICEFDTATGKKVAGIGGGHRGPVSLLALSDDGKVVITHSRSDSVRCWDALTGRELSQVAIPENATCAACSADGQRFAASLGNTVTVYDSGGKALSQFDAGATWGGRLKSGVLSLAFSPDGRVLAVRGGLPPEVHLWDTTTGKHLVALAQTQGIEEPRVIGKEHGEAWGMMTLDLAFSSDGRHIVGAGAKRELIRWDSQTGEPIWTMAVGAGQAAVERFALSANDHALATLNSDGTITLYEAATGEQRVRLGKPEENPSGGPLAPRSVGGRQPAGNRSAVSFAGLSIPSPRFDEPLALAFGPDGHYLATAKGNVIRLWDVFAGKEIDQLKGPDGGVVSLMFTPDSTRLLSGNADTTALAWDLSRTLRAVAVPEGRLDAKALDGLWADLVGKDAAKAFDALRKLSASPAQAVALVKERVRPVVSADTKRVAALIADLKSDQFAVRQKAEAGLEALGDLAEPGLRQALGQDPEIDLRQRLERLLRHAKSGGMVGNLRAVELLELIGGADARSVLDHLSSGAPGRLTCEARAATERLAKRPASNR